MTSQSAPGRALVLRDGEIDGHRVDVRVESGRVVAVEAGLPVSGQDQVFDVGGGAVLPGLHDHHIHLLALAAALDSISVGPPEVRDERGLAVALHDADADADAGAAAAAGAWLRAVGYHESVAGPLDRHVLDRLVPGRPVRVQHRSGALWILNSAALDAVGARDAVDVAGIERDDHGEPTGRLWRLDGWLRGRVPARVLDLAAVGDLLLRAGVTGVTDATPTDDPGDVELLAAAVRTGALAQRVVVTGGPALGLATDGGPIASSLNVSGCSATTTVQRTGSGPGWGPEPAAESAGGLVPEIGRSLELGPVKLLVSDHAIPTLDELTADVRRARAQGRAVAVHCVTRVALALTLAALEEVGAVPGDRIEHGAVMDLDTAAQLAAMGVTVVTNPSFVAERGDRYLLEVDADDLRDLWRCRSLLDHGVEVGAGTDAPFGRPDPWAAIAAAADRLTAAGVVLGPDEALPARRALDLFLTPLEQPGGPARRVALGAPADLCILHAPLAGTLADPRSAEVIAVVTSGALHSW